MEGNDHALPLRQIERRAVKACPYMELVDDRLTRGNERMDRIEKALNDNNAATAEVLDIMRLGKSFFRMAGYFGAFVKWLTPIGIAFAALWHSTKDFWSGK